MWFVLHLLALFIAWPLLFLTVPMHIVSSVKRDNAKTREYIAKHSQK
jgi:hypothetical protein